MTLQDVMMRHLLSASVRIPVATMNPLISVMDSAFGITGRIFLDPSKIRTRPDKSRKFYFEAALYCDPGASAEIRLYDTIAGAVVAGSLLTTSSPAPILVVGEITQDLSPVSSSRLYEVQLRRSVGLITDKVYVASASIVVEEI